EASSINFRRSVTYGLGVLKTTMQFALERAGLAKFSIFSEKGRHLETEYYKPGAAKTHTSGL
ncbi:MAG: hypothetical protein WA618_01920, partial [Terriglobales bacterium]